MPPRNKQAIFEVTGTGNFPFDMLRYDGCWPARQIDVPLLTDNGHRTARTIRLEGFAPAPTVERWRSFGWYAVVIS